MNRDDFPPIGREIAEQIEAFHVRGGMDPKEARETGDCLAELMLSVYAGEKVTFPADPFRGAYLEQRNAEIRRRFDGRNAPVLAVEYGLSRQQIYRIVTSDDSTM